MFSQSHPLIMIAGVLLGILIIGAGVASVNRLSATTSQDVLVRFILMVFAALVGVFVVDKLVAFRINLLTPELSDKLFELIRTLILIVFSYYFGTQKGSPK